MFYFELATGLRRGELLGLKWRDIDFRTGAIRIQRVLKDCGMEKLRFHDLRYTFATLALQNGVDVKTLSGLLGHYSAAFILEPMATSPPKCGRMRPRRWAGSCGIMCEGMRTPVLIGTGVNSQ